MKKYIKIAAMVGCFTVSACDENKKQTQTGPQQVNLTELGIQVTVEKEAAVRSNSANSSVINIADCDVILHKGDVANLDEDFSLLVNAATSEINGKLIKMIEKKKSKTGFVVEYSYMSEMSSKKKWSFNIAKVINNSLLTCSGGEDTEEKTGCQKKVCQSMKPI